MLFEGQGNTEEWPEYQVMINTKIANNINPDEASITVKNATIASRKGYGILANDSSIKKMTLVLENVTISGKSR